MWWKLQRPRKGSERSFLALLVIRITGRWRARMVLSISMMSKDIWSRTSSMSSWKSVSALSISSINSTVRRSAVKAWPILPMRM